MDLNTVWFLLVGVLIIGYAVLDGFDLGIGSLYFLLGKTDREKRVLLNSVGPFWDANEVWLLTAGGALFAAFPVVYASVFSGFYLAMMLVVLGLIFRAAAVEFRHRVEDAGWQRRWDALFFLGSFLPALLFGVAVGNIVQGLPLDSSQNYTGGFFALLDPFSLLIGLVGLFGFLMQGVTYTMIKTEGDLLQRARSLAPKIWAGLAGLFVLGGVGSWFAAPGLFTNYVKYPVLLLIPAVTVIALLGALAMIRANKAGLAFLSSSSAMAGMILILAAGLFPNLVPATDPALSLTVYNASSSPLTLKTMLIIALMGVPVVLFYTIYVYRVFRGKIDLEKEGY